MEELIKIIASTSKTHATRIIALDGLGASGKSTLAHHLSTLLPAEIVQIDDFYDAATSTFDYGRLKLQVIDPLTNDQPAKYQQYDWSTDSLTTWQDVYVGGTIIIEGVGAIKDELGKYWDYAIYVDCPRETRLLRGLARDGESLRNKWENVWMPLEDDYYDSERPDLKANIILH